MHTHTPDLFEDALTARGPRTHLGHVLDDRGITYIRALSPQAKGRLERLWQTLQDRLVAELALAGCASIAALDAFLPDFIARYNREFGLPAPGAPVWRPPPADFAERLGCCSARVVGRDHVVTIPGRAVQLPTAGLASRAGRRVEVRELLDGRVLVLLGGQLLATQAAQPGPFTLVPRASTARDRRLALGIEYARPPRATVTPPPTGAAERATPSRRPAPDHPWHARGLPRSP